MNRGDRMPRPCPTPGKQAHDSCDKAWRHANHLRRTRHASVDVKPYACVCGAWHVGHSQASLSYRIREARRKGTA